jgi:hypothetical protein
MPVLFKTTGSPILFQKGKFFSLSVSACKNAGLLKPGWIYCLSPSALLHSRKTPRVREMGVLAPGENGLTASPIRASKTESVTPSEFALSDAASPRVNIELKNNFLSNQK